MTPAEIVSGAFRGLELAGLLGFVGVVVMRQLARQPPDLRWVRPRMDRALALALLVDELHVASAGIWAGGVLVLATLRPPDGWPSPEGQDLLTRFGRVAMVAFAFTALTGLLRATEELTGFSDLWQTVYGVVLVAK